MWVGAVSFEDRCTRSLKVLHQASVKLSHVCALNYKTTAYPADQDREKRKGNLSDLRSLARAAKAAWKPLSVEEYSYYSVRDVLGRFLFQAESGSTIVIDITCLTKIHTIAIAALLPLIKSDVVIAYTSPDNYPHPGERKLAWKDIIIGPIGGTGSLRNEQYSRGIILTGLESARLIVSLSEIEPSGGIVVLTLNEKRPDLTVENMRKNQRIVSQLTSGPNPGWKVGRADIRNHDALKGLVCSEICEAEKHNAPMFLFPFGPKSFVFYAALILAERYDQSAWFVYPIPAFYEVGYTEGSASTSWLKLLRNYETDALPGPASGIE
jgi:hypothetical protein